MGECTGEYMGECTGKIMGVDGGVFGECMGER